jgi:uncharacterized protein (DUF2344 family)
MTPLEIARHNAKHIGKHKVSLEKTKNIIITCLKNELIDNKITKSKREQILVYMKHHVDMSISLYLYAQNRHREWEEEVKRLEGEKRKE